MTLYERRGTLLGDADGLLAIEHRPAEFVPKPLVVQDKFANRFRQLFTLPLAFEAASFFSLTIQRSSAHGFDRVGGYMRRHRRTSVGSSHSGCFAKIRAEQRIAAVRGTISRQILATIALYIQAKLYRWDTHGEKSG